MYLLLHTNFISTIRSTTMTNLEEQRKLEGKIDEVERQLAALKLEQLERVFRILQNEKDKEQDQ